MSNVPHNTSTRTVHFTDAHTVRTAIARTILGALPPHVQLGTIHLHRHQIDALVRIQAAIQEFGGALLCDTVGLGKTYVALAVATAYSKILIVAPAVLTSMWHDAVIHTQLNQRESQIRHVSLESLSHSSQPLSTHDLIIVDEAHHARNRATKRYAALSALCAHAHVLLMSATPIHNTHDDLTTLLALFLGARAHTLADHELSRLLIRRTHMQTKRDHSMPHVRRTHWQPLSLPQNMLKRILALPPPLPPRNAGVANHFVTLALLRQWISSDAALRAALHRRITRADALLTALNTGRYPTVQELRAWVYADHTTQLALTELLIPSEPNDAVDATTLTPVVHTHVKALTQLVHSIPTISQYDEWRAEYIRTIRHHHPHEKIVAFSQYTETITTLFRLLYRDGYVAAVTSRGGRIASGPLPRNDILSHFSPHSHTARPSNRRDRITLLLATDLLSEGVNLQEASVIIHLDLPWTNATLEQRVGRIARLGSRHQHVTVYGLLPPPTADAALRTTPILYKKAHLAKATIGDSSPVAFVPATQSDASLSPTPLLSIPEYNEAIRICLVKWLADSEPISTSSTSPSAPTSVITQSPELSTNDSSHTSPSPHSDPRPCLVSALRGQRYGFLAACIVDNIPMLIATTPTGEPTIAVAHVHQAICALTQLNYRDQQPYDPRHPPRSLSQRPGSRHRRSVSLHQRLDSLSRGSSVHTHHPHRQPAPSLPDTIVRNAMDQAFTAIAHWYDEHRAAADAGLGTLLANQRTDTKTKRSALRRLDTYIATAPWNRRVELVHLASTARRAMRRQMPTFLEQSFDKSYHNLPFSAPIPTPIPTVSPTSSHSCQIIALLLVVPPD